MLDYIEVQGKKSKLGAMILFISLLIPMIILLTLILFIFLPLPTGERLSFAEVDAVILIGFIFLAVVHWIMSRRGYKMGPLDTLTFIHERCHEVTATLFGYKVPYIEVKRNKKRKSRGFCHFQENETFQLSHFCMIVMSPFIAYVILYSIAIPLALFFIPSLAAQIILCIFCLCTMNGLKMDILMFFEVINPSIKVKHLKYYKEKFHIKSA